MAETTLNVGPEAGSSTKGVPRVKPAPMAGKMPVKFSYSPSWDGIDENLLILLHGLGEQLGIRGKTVPAKTLMERGHRGPICEAWAAAASTSDCDTILEGTWAVIADFLELECSCIALNFAFPCISAGFSPSLLWI
jgi:hypothetical protein